MDLFRGYIRTKDKKAIEPFKNRKNFDPLSEVEKNEEYAGVLADDTVLIDVDDEKQSDILMSIVDAENLACKVNHTTRGRHFFFKNNGKFTACKTDVKLACGLTADIKLGSRNSIAILKFNGKVRKTEWDILDDEQYQEAPAWLQPVASSVNFLDMTEGDGRDSALYSYILSLQSAGLSKDDAIKSIKLINEYLLKDKLSNADIDRITRDEAFLKPIFFEKGQFLFDKFAQFMISEHHIIRIDSQLHMYRDGVYIAGASEIENAMIKHIPQLSRAKRSEVYDYIDISIREDTPATDAKYIAFKNGLLNIQDDTFEKFTPDVVVTNIIPHDYDPDAYDELTDKTLDKISCNNKSIRALLEEMAGYCLYRRNELGKAFILTGSGSNGKSTYLNMIKEMLGKSNISVLDMKKLNDRFSTIMMYRKLANVGDDISDGYIDDSAEFKKIVTGDAIDAEQKGQPKFNFEPYVKLIFSANNVPRIGKGKDTTAIKRRLVIIPFNAQFKSSDPDFVPFISDKLKADTAIQYLIKLGVSGLKRVLIDNRFTACTETQRELDDFEEANNPIIQYLHDTDKKDLINVPTREAYMAYNAYCTETGISALGHGEFTKQIKKYYGLIVADRKINGKRFRTFVE
jgi:putative DNA primase/helicase